MAWTWGSLPAKSQFCEQRTSTVTYSSWIHRIPAGCAVWHARGDLAVSGLCGRSGRAAAGSTSRSWHQRDGRRDESAHHEWDGALQSAHKALQSRCTADSLLRSGESIIDILAAEFMPQAVLYQIDADCPRLGTLQVLCEVVHLHGLISWWALKAHVLPNMRLVVPMPELLGDVISV